MNLQDVHARKLNQHLIKKNADLTTIRYSVERNISTSVCVRLRLQGKVEFSPGYWSAPVCLSGMILQLWFI